MPDENAPSPEARIAKALEFARRYPSTDGAHHKTWLVDQMVRALTGCQMVRRFGDDYQGRPYEYDAWWESPEYEAFRGAEGDWDEGTAP